MSNIVVKKIPEDFPNGFFRQNLIHEIKQSSEITTKLTDIVVVDINTVHLVFTTEPSADELERGLIGICYSHDSRPSVWKQTPNDFPNGFSIIALNKAIKNDTTIGGSKYDGMVHDSGTNFVKMMFNIFPNSEGLDILNGICVNYDQYVAPARTNSTSIAIKNDTVADDNFSLVSRFQFNAEGKTLDYMDVIAYTLDGTYDLKLVNARLKTVVSTKTGFTNNDFDLVTLDNFSSQPASNTILELYARVASGKGPVTIDQATLWFH